jgi:hypothetical protein
MKLIKSILSLALWLAALAFACCVTLAAYRFAEALVHVTRMIDEFPRLLRQELQLQAQASREEIQATRAALVAEIQATRRDLRAELRLTRSAAERQIDNLASRLDARLADVAARADQRLGQAVDVVDVRLGEVTQQLTQSIANTDQQIVQLVGDTDRMIKLITPQALGTIAATKVAAGAVAKTAKTWERESPAIAQNVKQTTGNAAKISRFLSKWKVILAVGGIIATAIGLH